MSVALANLLFRAGSAAVAADPSSLGFIRYLLKKPNTQLFDRIFRAICAANIDHAEAESRAEILAGKAYGLIDFDFEFCQLVEVAVARYGAQLLDEGQCSAIIEKILAGPSQKNFINGGEPEEAEARWQRARAHFHLRQIAPFSPILPVKYREHFDGIEKGGKPVRHRAHCMMRDPLAKPDATDQELATAIRGSLCRGGAEPKHSSMALDPWARGSNGRK